MTPEDQPTKEPTEAEVEAARCWLVECKWEPSNNPVLFTTIAVMLARYAAEARAEALRPVTADEANDAAGLILADGDVRAALEAFLAGRRTAPLTEKP